MEFYSTRAQILHEHVLLTYPTNHLTMYHCSPPKPKAGVVLYSTLQASHQGVTGKMVDDAAELFYSSEKGEESDEDEIVEFSPEVVSNPPPSTTPASSVKATPAPSAGGSSAAGAGVQISSKRKLIVQPTPAAGGAGTKASPTPDAGADAKVKGGNAGGRPMTVANVLTAVVKDKTENPSMDIRVKVKELYKIEDIDLQKIAPLVAYATEYVYGVVASDEQSVRDLINKTIKKEEEKEILIKYAGVIDGILIRNGDYDWEVSCFMHFSKTFQTTPLLTFFCSSNNPFFKNSLRR